MKGAITGAALVAALAVAGAATRSLWVAPDIAQAQAWLRDAADRRDTRAEAALARWSARGDAAARHAYAALLAHRSDAPSRQRLQQVLADGARAGDAADATWLAELLSPAGARAPGDDGRVARLLAQGIAAHVPAASRLMALRALDPAHGTPDPARAATWMRQAADGGDAQAMFFYANLLRAGTGVPRDDAKALALYQAAADADYAPAIQALALAWRYGELGLAADDSQARLMDHEAAEALAQAAR